MKAASQPQLTPCEQVLAKELFFILEHMFFNFWSLVCAPAPAYMGLVRLQNGESIENRCAGCKCKNTQNAGRSPAHGSVQIWTESRALWELWPWRSGLRDWKKERESSSCFFSQTGTDHCVRGMNKGSTCGTGTPANAPVFCCCVWGFRSMRGLAGGSGAKVFSADKGIPVAISRGVFWRCGDESGSRVSLDASLALRNWNKSHTKCQRETRQKHHNHHNQKDPMFGVVVDWKWRNTQPVVQMSEIIFGEENADATPHFAAVFPTHWSRQDLHGHRLASPYRCQSNSSLERLCCLNRSSSVWWWHTRDSCIWNWIQW